MTALKVAGVAAGGYGTYEAANNGMHATAAVAAALTAFGLYDLLSQAQGTNVQADSLGDKQFADTQQVLNDATGSGEMSWSAYVHLHQPDDDDYLTLGEANWQWQHGKGAPGTVDADKLDFSGLHVSDFPSGAGGGSTRPFTLPRWEDFVVHGTVTTKLNPNSTVCVGVDKVNFDLEPWYGHFTRNVYALALRGYVGNGTPFDACFRGDVSIPA